MKITNYNIIIIFTLELAVLPFIKSLQPFPGTEYLISKSSNQNTINNNQEVKNWDSKSKTPEVKKRTFLNLQENKNNTNSNNTKTIKKEDHIGNISNATLINMIIEQTELMKSEICKSGVDIIKGLDKLMNSVTLIKKKLKQITSVNIISKDEIILDFTICINNLNLIRAELNKMLNLLENIKKANCKELTDSQKKYDQAKNYLNKLVESIQNFLRKTNLDFNLLILT